MDDFIITASETNGIIAEFENSDFSAVLTEIQSKPELYVGENVCIFVNHVGETVTTPVAVFDGSTWYEADGYTVLNW